MSGDVQPRKRKDKKRRKDDAEPIPLQAHAPIFTNSLVNDDVNIHVHKESGTGGGICAKLVFFILLSALAVLIGLIITEHRGLTDLDAADYDSKFSQIFEGWIDTSSNNHDDHDVEDAPHADHEDDHDEDHEELDVSEADDEDHQASREEEEHQQSEEDEEHQPSEEDEERDRSEEEVDEAEDESLEEDDEDNEDRDEEPDKNYSEEDNEEVRDDGSYEIDRDDEEEPDEDLEESREHSEENGDEMQASDEEEQVQDDENELDSDEELKEEEVGKDELDDGDKDGESKEEMDDESADDDVTSTEEATRVSNDDQKDESSAEETEVTEKKLSRRSIGAESDQVEIPETSNGINTPQDQVGDSDSDRQSDDVEYEQMNITNKDDFKIRREIDEAQKAVENNPNYAIRLFDTILQKSPSSPRSLYGKALALDRLADRKRSNSVLEQALKLYMQLLRNKNVPVSLFELAAERCLNRMRFLGQYTNAILVHKLVIDRFPNIPQHLNDMAVTYLTINRVDDARSVLKRVLAKWPSNGVALVHYGFILKTADNKLESAVFYLQRGIRTREKGVLDGRFFFHLGDALTRLGRAEEAMKVYEEGTELKVFLSKYQRSLYNVPRLTGRPWWQPKDLPYLNSFKLLRQNWRKISEEALSILNVRGYFQDESENLKDTGEWKQFELYARGQKNARNCGKCPFTCSIMDQIPEAVSCRRGQTKFSVMHPGTHVWPHCGPTNCRLRTHLGLRVPPNTHIRVASETRSWKEGEILVFDDSFEHEVWHNGTEFRLVLIVDVWHPELTPSEKKNLSPI